MVSVLFTFGQSWSRRSSGSCWKFWYLMQQQNLRCKHFGLCLNFKLLYLSYISVFMIYHSLPFIFIIFTIISGGWDDIVCGLHRGSKWNMDSWNCDGFSIFMQSLDDPFTLCHCFLCIIIGLATLPRSDFYCATFLHYKISAINLESTTFLLKEQTYRNRRSISCSS